MKKNNRCAKEYCKIVWLEEGAIIAILQDGKIYIAIPWGLSLPYQENGKWKMLWVTEKIPFRF